MDVHCQDIAGTIAENCDIAARRVVHQQYQLHPEFEQRFGPAGALFALEDVQYHLRFLVNAIAVGRPALFADYVAWTRTVLASRNVPADVLVDNLHILGRVLCPMLPASGQPLLQEYLDSALALLPAGTGEPPSFLDPATAEYAVATDYLDDLLQARRAEAFAMIQTVLACGTSIQDLYMRILQPVQHEIERLWQLNRITVAQEHYATAATQSLIAQLYPRIFSMPRCGKKLVATCVGEELHELGLRMVCDFFELEGWTTLFLGASTPTPALLQMVAVQQPDLLMVSATMTFHLREMSSLIAATRRDPGCRDIPILVGGRPFNLVPDLWRQVGADAYAVSAAESVPAARALLNHGGEA